MSLQNPHWQTFEGDPIGGRVPTRTKVESPENTALTSGQLAFVSGVYRHFCAMVNTSSIPNGHHSVVRTMPDGTVVRVLSIMGQHRVFVTVPGGKEQEVEPPSGIGICVTDPNGDPLTNLRVEVSPGVYEPQPLLLKPGVKKILDPDDATVTRFRSSGEWKVKPIDRITGSRKIWVSADRKHYFGIIGEWPLANLYGEFQQTTMASRYEFYMKFNPKWLTSGDIRTKLTSGWVTDSRYVNKNNDTHSILPDFTIGTSYQFFHPPFVAKLPTGSAVYYLMRSNAGGTGRFDLYKGPIEPVTGLWKQDADTSNAVTLSLVADYLSPGSEVYQFDSLLVRGDGRQAIVRASKSGVGTGHMIIDLTDEGTLAKTFELDGGWVYPEDVRTLTYDRDASLVGTLIKTPTNYAATSCGGSPITVVYDSVEQSLLTTYADYSMFKNRDVGRFKDMRYWDRDDKPKETFYKSVQDLEVELTLLYTTTSIYQPSAMPNGPTTVGPGGTVTWTLIDKNDVRVTHDSVSRSSWLDEDWFEVGNKSICTERETRNATIRYQSDRQRANASSPYTGPTTATIESVCTRTFEAILLHLHKLDVTFVLKTVTSSSINQVVDLITQTASNITLPITNNVNTASIIAYGPTGNVLFETPLTSLQPVRTTHTVTRSSLMYSAASAYDQAGQTGYSSTTGLVDESFITLSSLQTCPSGPRMGATDWQTSVGTARLTNDTAAYTTPGASESSIPVSGARVTALSVAFQPLASSTVNAFFTAQDYIMPDFAEDPTTSAFVVSLASSSTDSLCTIAPFSLLLVVDDDESGNLRVSHLKDRLPSLNIPDGAVLWPQYPGNSLMTI